VSSSQISYDNHTCIIALVDNNKICIGADGLVTNKFYSKDKEGKVTKEWNEKISACKIFHIQTMLFCATGVRFKTLLELAKEIIIPGKSLNQVIEEYIKKALNSFEEDLNKTRVENEFQYNATFNKSFFSQIVLASFEGKRPRMINIQFAARIENDKVSIKFHKKEYTIPTDGSPVIGAWGHYDGGIIKGFDTKVRAGQYEKAIEGIIQMQSKKTPSSVGEPISIALMTNVGVFWVNKGACQ
jgi:hypothetical protein